MKSIVQFISEQLNVNEAISNSNIEGAHELIATYLKKWNSFVFPGLDEVNVGGAGNMYGYLVVNKRDTAAFLLWEKRAENTNLKSIAFYSKAREVVYAKMSGSKAIADVMIECNGASLASCLPLIVRVLNGEIAMNSSAIEKAIQSKRMYESMEDLFEKDHGFGREYDELDAQTGKLYYQRSKMRAAGQDTTQIEQELRSIRDRMSAIRKGVPTTIVADPRTEKQEEVFKKRATPQQKFKQMEIYLNMLLKGMKPSLIVSGAPGVGKTYRITEIVKQHKEEFETCYFISGKETPQKLYMDLFEYSRKGDVLVIDDADDIITNETSINLLKAATDSKKQRFVSYGTSRPPMASKELQEMKPWLEFDEDPKTGAPVYPSHFAYDGSVIIITNMVAGQLDTALRNRAFICNMDFTVEECLSLIEDLMPVISDGYIRDIDKKKSLAYLKTLAEKKAPMEISIRSFQTCAQIYYGCDDEEMCEMMISEAMELMFARGGKRY